MRRFASLLWTLALAAALACPARAAISAEIIRAFVYEETLYTYMRLENTDQPITRAEAKIGPQSFPASTRLETVRQAGSPVTWLLLVDNSTSMPDFREEAEAFAESLSASSGENTRLILATFGDAFAVVDGNVPPDDLKGAVAAIPMDERITRLHTAINQALDYFEGLPRERNELRCMVILSDAVQYDPSGGVPYEELLERVSGSGVMLHSVGLGNDQASLDSMGRLAEASGGLHQVLGEVSPGDAGTALAEFGETFFVTGFDLVGCSAPIGETAVSVTMAAGSELVGRAETVVDLPELEGVSGEAPAPSQTLPPSSESQSGAASGGAAAPEPFEEDDLTWVFPAAASAAVLAVLAVVVLVLRRRQAAPAEDVLPAPETVRGVYMRLVVLEGALASGPEELELTEPLFIGSDPGCTIVLRAGDGEERHARVFLTGGAVYLEDLQTLGGTMVNGTRLDLPRVLRSGDSVTIGGLTFQLKF